jgi:hypothetical protein
MKFKNFMKFFFFSFRKYLMYWKVNWIERKKVFQTFCLRLQKKIYDFIFEFSGFESIKMINFIEQKNINVNRELMKFMSFNRIFCIPQNCLINGRENVGIFQEI